MEPLRVLVCGGDNQVLQKMAYQLSDEGITVETSTRLIDRICRPGQEWDLLLVHLDGLTSLLRGLLPAIRRQFPNLNVLGISHGTALDINFLAYDFELDGYMFGSPRPEDLIVRLPRLAANYLCEAGSMTVVQN